MPAPENKLLARDLPGAAADLLDRIRERSPRVHCVTNVVAQNFTANVLLAIGAIPSMTIAADEIAEFLASADALLVNLGTLDADRRAAIEIATAAANDKGIPWLLDPVFVDRSRLRAGYARSLVTRRPKAVRLNVHELAAMVDAQVDGAALARFSESCGTVVGLTGEQDIIFDNGRLACIGNGHDLMAKVTAMGCVGGAVIGACMAVESDAWVATAAGLLILAVAGEVAGRKATGPGSFVAGILDTLYTLNRATLMERAKVV